MIYAYLRFSQIGQSAGSIDRQQTVINNYCTAHGLVVDKEFQDLGKSGYSDSGNMSATSELSRLMDVIKYGDTLLIERQSRLSRQTYKKVGKLMTKLLDAGITIITCNDGQISKNDVDSNLADDLKRLIEAHVAYKESKDKSDFAAAGFVTRKKKVAEGLVVRVGAASWLSFDNGKYRLNEYADVVARMFNMCIAGAGCTTIAKRLNDEKVKTFKRDKDWSSAGILSILNNVACYGEYEGRNYFPPAVSKDVWLAAKGVIALRKTMKTTRQAAQTNPFSGILYCGYCESKMHISGKWVICYGKRAGGCTAPNVESSKAIQALDKILTYFNTSALTTNVKTQNDADALSGLIVIKQKKLKGIEDAASNSEEYDPLLTALARTTRAELQDLQAKAQEAAAAVADEPSKLDVMDVKTNRWLQRMKFLFSIERNGLYCHRGNSIVAACDLRSFNVGMLASETSRKFIREPPTPLHNHTREEQLEAFMKLTRGEYVEGLSDEYNKGKTKSM
ncbi:MAG: recombinase family protein [Undibacterium sp.]|uniref:recombinase family protein n=1 Tax=Undibacterium sp. TaxID=1914977 RepID=UPI0027163F14|nr:recombinase family protein [Undibacterium sp.]MDO8652021.1 recombinase family protein [Undibacterium sp.]